jgi:squalene synthase HpnC
MGVGHYENFPVASVLLPAHLRASVAAIYRFARTADDYADEGDLTPPERLARLRLLGAELDRIERGDPSAEPLAREVAQAVARHNLPLGPFHDLLDAFSQDVLKSRYASFAELLDYSRRSADPIGRLLLHVFDAAGPETFRCSDLICSALQFINFWQDTAIDYAKGRIYLPQDDMTRYGVTEAELAAGEANAAFRDLMRFEIARTRAMLHEGAALGRMLPGRIGLEIRMVVAGGDTILQKVLDANCDVFRARPVLRAPDWVSMLIRAVFGDGRVAA